MGSDAKYLWDRRDDEPVKQFLWFDRYRSLGPERTYVAAWKSWEQEQYEQGLRDFPPPSEARLHMSGGWQEAATKFDWADRADAFDLHMREQRFRRELDERAKMYQRHIEIALEMQRMGLDTIKDYKTNHKVLSQTEARQYIKTGVEMERKARGIPEYMVRIAEMENTELLEKYAKFLEELGADLEGTGDVQDGDSEEGVEVTEAA
jgi:hypothetical protein